MYHLVLVAAGGAVGAGLRHLVNLATLRLFGSGFPWGTLTVNVVGSLAMGLFMAWLVRRTGSSAELRLLVATGLFGGFTTFSAFSLDFAVLYERGALMQAFSYVAASVLLSIGALFVGLWVARNLA
ncbi:MAG: fluoride efflux transporter CrcB [Neoaquamicrobium sediminum]|uniref:fluoride efflux transporter CrcB n=1 Tax=Neoaquamicrobium sediminum TaxID=1849104 RepID=UPI001567BD64|nr:fluoride efflux transporter CrcB [Mesorhizobium sediminum]MBX9450283.1 fluoride efflux transporter CrcB [Mesorhizobium sp.]NRC54888.1 fluoride efflux transporter CrcB [Mesorhizobium sediminum]